MCKHAIYLFSRIFFNFLGIVLMKQVEVPRELRPKRFPHYMERENGFKSESILGKIYDEVDAYEQEDNSKKGEGLQ